MYYLANTGRSGGALITVLRWKPSVSEFKTDSYLRLFDISLGVASGPYVPGVTKFELKQLMLNQPVYYSSPNKTCNSLKIIGLF